MLLVLLVLLPGLARGRVLMRRSIGEGLEVVFEDSPPPSSTESEELGSPLQDSPPPSSTEELGSPPQPLGYVIGTDRIRKYWSLIG